MERNRIVTIFSLLFVLAMVNMAMGGPQGLPRLSHDTAMMVAGICGGVALLFCVILAMDRARELNELVDTMVKEELVELERKAAIRERRRQLAENPDAPPETLAEQMQRKKDGL